MNYPPPISPTLNSPVSDKTINVFRPEIPLFYSKFEVAPVKNMPFSKSDSPDLYWWVRHVDKNAQDSTIGLLALADALVPAYGVMMTGWTPMSSMNWMINILSDKPKTENGWWLLRTTADSAIGGFSSQNMAIWSTTGECVLLGRQLVSIFG